MLKPSVETPVPGSADSVPAFGSDAVVDLLKELGVRYLPMTPGSSFRGLHDSVVNHGGNSAPQLLLCLHEEIAVALAHGYAKGAREVGVAAVHDLVGLMHASMGVYDAFCDRAPILLLGGSGPADPARRRSIDWVHSASTQAQLVRDYVVWDAEPTTLEGSLAEALRGYQRAASAPRGPAYVSLDAGVQEAPLPESVCRPDVPAHAPSPPFVPDSDSVAHAVKLIRCAEQPVVVAGQLGWDPAATPVLTELVELLGAPYHEDRNSVAFPTTHPQNCTGDPRVFTDADVVVAIDVMDIPGLLRTPTRGRTSVQATPHIIDISLGTLGLRSWSHAFAAPVPRSAQLLGDPLLGTRLLVDELRRHITRDTFAGRRAASVRRAQHQRERSVAAVHARWDERPITPGRLVAETWHAVQHVDHLLCLRNTRTWPEGIWQLSGAGSYLGHSTGGGVGYGPGALVGGALAARDRGSLGVGIVGDGDLLMASGALWTAVHYGIPALVVVNDNGSLYNDESHQAMVARERERPVDNSWIGMRITQPRIDIEQLARAYGCWTSETIIYPDVLASALRHAVQAAEEGKVAVVPVQTAPQ